MTGDGKAPEQVERTHEDSQLEDLMVFLVFQRVKPNRKVRNFSSRSLFKRRDMKASSESGAGPWFFVESTKGVCAPRRNE